MSDERKETETASAIKGIVARGVAISGAGNMILRSMEIVIAVLLLRWLTIFEFGVYRLALAAYDFGTGFFLSGIENVVVSDVSGELKTNPEKAKRVFTAYVFFMGAAGMLLWAAFFFGSGILQRWVPEGAKHLKTISFLFLLAPFETAFKLKFQIFLDFKWGVIFRILRDIFRLFAILSLFLFASFGIREALWSLIVAVTLPIMAAGIFYRRESLMTRLSWEDARGVFSDLFFTHGKWAIFDDFASNIGKNIRPFIIKIFAGTEAVAIFAVAQNLLGYATSLFPIRDILTPVLPRVSDDPARLRARIMRASKYATYGYILLMLASAIGAPILVYLLFPKYIPSLPFFYILLFGLPWLGFRSVAQPVFYALKAQQTLFLLTATRLILITILGVFLISQFGVLGAAIEAAIVGILITPAFSRALKNIIPGWRFEVRSLFSFDSYDRELILQIKNRLHILTVKLFRLSERNEQ